MTAPDTKGTPAAAKKTADDIAAATAVGQKVTLTGTFDSYHAEPADDHHDAMVRWCWPKKTPAKAPAKPPVHHTAPHK